MSSVGHVLDNMRRNAANRQASKERRARSAALRKNYMEPMQSEGLDFPQVTPEEAQAVKQQIERTIQQDRRRAAIVASLMVVAVCGVLFALWWFVMG